MTRAVRARRPQSGGRRVHFGHVRPRTSGHQRVTKLKYKKSMLKVCISQSFPYRNISSYRVSRGFGIASLGLFLGSRQFLHMTNLALNNVAQFKSIFPYDLP